ncbi:TRAP transporter small permease subunit [Sediminimonas qiaohouensis]|uniref:TRAP transporter small permease subunit n=1 Tax=Sediminimonas qiaohouensis TaxID=552061 RepID=UPI0004085A4F|nr:TRAP transporter small permease subunit [Sediminimonas qiaohouensis]
MRILNWIDWLNLWVGRLVSHLIWVGAAVLVFEVVSRYVFASPTVWAHGYTQRIYAVYFILIGAYALLRNAHVRVDILMIGRSARVRSVFDILSYSMLLIWCAALSYEGWNFFQEAMLWNEKDDSALAHPLWPVKLVLVIAAVLFALQAFAGLVRSIHGAFVPSDSVSKAGAV